MKMRGICCFSFFFNDAMENKVVPMEKPAALLCICIFVSCHSLFSFLFAVSFQFTSRLTAFKNFSRGIFGLFDVFFFHSLKYLMHKSEMKV